MRLPFTEAPFLDVFAAYNLAFWPAAVLLWIWTFVATARLIGGKPASASLSLLAAVHWGWSAVAYHALFFARINPAARIFAALFMLQAFGLLRFGLRYQPTFSVGRTVRHRIAALFLVYSLLYPALALLSVFELPRAPLFAVPCPTVLFTAGVLLAAETPVSRTLFVMPILWSFVGGSAAMLFDVLPDLMLLLAGGSLATVLFSDRRSAVPYRAALHRDAAAGGQRS